MGSNPIVDLSQKHNKKDELQKKSTIRILLKTIEWGKTYIYMSLMKLYIQWKLDLVGK